MLVTELSPLRLGHLAARSAQMDRPNAQRWRESPSSRSTLPAHLPDEMPEAHRPVQVGLRAQRFLPRGATSIRKSRRDGCIERATVRMARIPRPSALHGFRSLLLRSVRMELAIQIQVEELPEGVFLATSDELPGLVAQGRTVAEALDIARDVARKLIEARSEREGAPKLPTTSERRDYTIVVAA